MLWPADEPWLTGTDPIPLLPVAQLSTRDVSRLSLTGDADLLQVFWCPFNAHGEERNVGEHSGGAATRVPCR